MDVTPRELREIDFRTEWKGYHRDDVDDLLERAATTIEADNERARQLNESLEGLRGQEGDPPTRETEDMLRRTLVLAQRAADEAIAEAKTEARRLTEEAETEAQRVTRDAQADARRVAESERERLEAEVLDLGSRRDALLADVEQLERYAKEYRNRLRAAIERDLETLASRNAVTDMARPTLHEVEIPSTEPKVDAPPAPASPAPAGSPPIGVAIPATPPTPGQGSPPPVAPSAPGTSPSAPSAPSAPNPAARVPAAGSSPPPSAGRPSPGAVPPQPAPTPPPSAPSLTAVEEPTRAVESVPDPPQAPKPPEAEVLDDDAFFASLREAVRDDTPLGPRPDDAESIADETDETGRFGNVFKRRR